MNLLRRLHDLVQLKIRQSATYEALEALSERQLADLGLADLDLARLARLAALPSSADLPLDRLAAMVREQDPLVRGGLPALHRRLVGAAVETGGRREGKPAGARIEQVDRADVAVGAPRDLLDDALKHLGQVAAAGRGLGDVLEHAQPRAGPTGHASGHLLLRVTGRAAHRRRDTSRRCPHPQRAPRRVPPAP